MTKKLRTDMGNAAVKAAEYIKYEGAGTIEFLVDKHRNFYFRNDTRIQVEHPITEQVIDYDLIVNKFWLLCVPISGKNYTPQLHSIECRINAEDLTMISALRQVKSQFACARRSRRAFRYTRLCRLYNCTEL